MTALDAPPEIDAEPIAPTRRRRRRPAPKANPFWRFVFPVMVLAAGAAVFALWRVGTKSVLDSTDGREVEIVVDPAAPGYEAFLDPTPTILVAHTDAGELVGVTVLAQTALDQGGSGVLLAADLLVFHGSDGSEEEAVFLSEAWAEGGMDRVELLVEQLFGFGFLETVELDVAAMATALGLVDPVPYLLSDDLVTQATDGSVELWLSRGRKELDASVAAELYGFRNPGEADANRVLRQIRLWEAWLRSIEQAEDPSSATLPFEDGLWPFLRSLGAGDAELVALPMEPVGLDPENPPFYIVAADEGDQWLRDRALEMVPLPISPRSSVRPTVRLLDGTGDPANRDRSRADVVAAGGVISVIGNADTFGVERTTVRYHRAETEAQAETIAEALGAEAELVDDVEQPIDLTVTIGLDQVDS